MGPGLVVGLCVVGFLVWLYGSLMIRWRVY